MYKNQLTWDEEAAKAAADEFSQALKAMEERPEMTPAVVIKEIGRLWKKTYMTAGHKKLGRVMISFAE